MEKYAPKNPRERLFRLTEEMAEVLHAIGKSGRPGLNSYNPEIPEDQRETNRDYLLRELNDPHKIAGDVYFDFVVRNLDRRTRK